jgi:hypothetical protein
VGRVAGDGKLLLELARCVLAPAAMSLRHGASAALALTVLALTGAACSPYRIAAPRAEVLHPFAPIPSEFARVCVIRTSHMAQAVTFTTFDNGALVGATKGPTFFCYKAEPGDHALRIEADEPTSLTFRAEGGQSYYLHQKVPFALMLRCDAAWVSQPVARDLVDDSTYEVLTQTPSGEPPPAPIPFAKAASK